MSKYHKLWKYTVNGSIWTLAYEFSIYITIALLGVFGVYKKMDITKIWSWLLILNIIMIVTGTQTFNYSLFYLNFNFLPPLAFLLFTGILFYKKINKIRLKMNWVIIGLSIFIDLSALMPNLS